MKPGFHLRRRKYGSQKDLIEEASSVCLSNTDPYYSRPGERSGARRLRVPFHIPIIDLHSLENLWLHAEDHKVVAPRVFLVLLTFFSLSYLHNPSHVHPHKFSCDRDPVREKKNCMLHHCSGKSRSSFLPIDCYITFVGQGGNKEATLGSKNKFLT